MKNNSFFEVWAPLVIIPGLCVLLAIYLVWAT